VAHLVLVAPVEDLGQAFEGVIDIATLESAYFEEIEANRFCEGQSVLGSNSDSRLKIDLVRYHHSHEGPPLVLLLDPL
jgi:hypothetical protein